MEPVHRPPLRCTAFAAGLLLALAPALAVSGGTRAETAATAGTIRVELPRRETPGLPVAAAPAPMFVKELVGRVYGASHDAALSPAGRRDKLRQLIDRGFDVPEVARFVLGRHWRAASEAERAEFTSAFGDYMVVAYTPQMSLLGEYGHAVTVTGQRADSDATIVLTSVPQRGGQPLLIDWRTVPAAGGYRVTDIMLDGLSLMRIKRDEIAALIARRGVGGMIAEIRDRAGHALRTDQAAGQP